MADTTHLQLPLMAAAQAQKHVTHNAALLRLDALVQLAVLDRDLTAPPANPSDGDRYIVASGATGAWADWDLSIAWFTDGVWTKLEPREGWRVWVGDADALLVWNGSEWKPVADAAGSVSEDALANGSIPLVGVNTGADADNRLAVKTNAVLLSHDDVTPGTGHLRATVNKSEAARDAGFIFQTGFSTRALFGLLGSDDFRITVSPDGSIFRDAIAIDRSTGKVSFPETVLYAEAMIRNSSTADINTAAWTTIPFTSPNVVTVDAGFAATSGGIRCDFGGRVEVTASIHCQSNNPRTSVAIRIARNGTDQGPRGASGYIRAMDGHNRASMHLGPMVVFVSNGDVITVEGQRDTAITGPVNLVADTSFLRAKRLPDI